MDTEKEAYLKSIYYDVSHPASYSGLDRLYREVKKEGRFQLTRKELKAWLKTQETYGIHKPARRRFKRPRVMVSGIGKQADVDLMDMTQLAEYNDGVRFVLLHINDFSRYVRTVPLHSKTGKEVAKALKSIFRDGGKTDTLRADKGKEWLNQTVQKLLKEERIHFFHTQNEPKASLAERAIRTIKSIYFKHMTQHQTFRYVDIIQEVTHAYNHRYHRSIRMAPADVTEDNQRQVWHNIYGGDKGFNMKPFTYNIGDWVRISYLKRTFDREYDEKWTREFFKVVKREYMQGKQLYTLEDYAGDPVEGRFYREELQPVTVTGDEVYKIEKVIKTVRKKGQPTQYLVRWLGWGPKYDSYINEAELQNIRGGVSTQ